MGGLNKMRGGRGGGAWASEKNCQFLSLCSFIPGIIKGHAEVHSSCHKEASKKQSYFDWKNITTEEWFSQFFVGNSYLH